MKRLWIFLLAVLVLAAFAGCQKVENAIEDKIEALEDRVENMATFVPVAPDQLITLQEAQSIALEHAGVTAEEATGLHTVMEIDDGRQEYEVEFRVGHLEYDYEIDAVTGQIISFDKDN